MAERFILLQEYRSAVMDEPNLPFVDPFFATSVRGESSPLTIEMMWIRSSYMNVVNSYLLHLIR